MLCFELGRRQVAERGVQPLLVVDLFQEPGDGGASLGQVPVFVPMYLLVLQGLHERFASRVVPRVRLARHTDVDAVRRGRTCRRVRWSRGGALCRLGRGLAHVGELARGEDERVVVLPGRGWRLPHGWSY